MRAYHHTYGLDVTTSHCSNNYGPYQYPEKLVPLFIVNILSGRALPLYGDGRHVRDWLHVADHCRAIERVIVAGKAGEIYNIGGRSECENLQLARLLCAIAEETFARRPELSARFASCPAALGRPAAGLISFVADRPGHDRRYAIDCRNVEAELGFSPSISLQNGLRETFSWFIDHEPWWRAIIDRTRAALPVAPLA